MFSRMGKLPRRQRFLLPVLLGVVATAADAAASGWPLQPFVSGNPTSTVGAQSLLCRLGSLQSPEEDGLVLAVPYHELSRWHSTNILPVYILDSAVRTFFPRYLLNPSSLFSIWCSSRFALLLYTSVWRGCSLAVCSVSPLFGASSRHSFCRRPSVFVFIFHRLARDFPFLELEPSCKRAFSPL